jgi:hypothetical protein
VWEERQPHAEEKLEEPEVMAPENPKEYSPKVEGLVEEIMQLNMYESVQLLEILKVRCFRAFRSFVFSQAARPNCRPTACVVAIRIFTMFFKTAWGLTQGIAF